MDDILIYTEDLKYHCKIGVRSVAQLLKYDLYLKPEKFDFEKQEMEYLGMTSLLEKYAWTLERSMWLRNWPTPKMLKDIRGFIGFSNFYRRFIKILVLLACPLHDLTKKDVPWHGDKEQ